MNFGCEARNERSKAPSDANSGGFGKTPCEKAKARMKTAITASKTASTQIAAPTAGYVAFGIEPLTRNSLMTSPPRAGMTLLKPYEAMYAPQMRRNWKRSVG